MSQLFNIFGDVKADKALDEIYDFYLKTYSKKTAAKVRGEIIDKI